MYFVYKKDGVIVDIIRTDRIATGSADDTVKLLTEGKADSIYHCANHEELIAVLNKSIPESRREEKTNFDRVFHTIADVGEKYINNLCDRLMQPNKKDADALYELAKKAGGSLLKGVRGLQKSVNKKTSRKRRTRE